MTFIHLAAEVVQVEDPDTGEMRPQRLIEQYINPDGIRRVQVNQWQVHIVWPDKSLDLPPNSQQAASMLRWLDANSGNY